MAAEVVMFGQLARDLAVRVADAPGPEELATVRSRRELLHGKGANQAVGLVQLGTRVALVVDVVDDHADGWYLEHLPDERDVFAASEPVRTARSVVIQLPQPVGAALEVDRLAAAASTEHAPGSALVDRMPSSPR